MDIWKLAYHLCGVTLLGRNGMDDLEPLTPLPMPVRNAVLRLAKCLEPDALSLEELDAELQFVDGSYRWIINWYMSDESLAKRIQNSAPCAPLEFHSTDEYFAAYNLYPPHSEPSDGHFSNPSDEHYAERRFVEEIVVPQWGIASLGHLIPQVPFGSNGRRIDFVIEGAKTFAIEIEGRTYHEFAAEEERKRELVDHDYSYYPIPYSDIDSGDAKTILEQLQQDEVIAKKVKAASTNALGVPNSVNVIANLFQGFVTRYQSYQVWVLSLLRNAVTESQERITLGDFQPRYPLFAIALCDTVLLLEQVARLYDMPLKLPQIDFYTIGEVGEHYQTLIDLYTAAGPLRNGKPLDRPKDPITFQSAVSANDLSFTHYSQAERHCHLPINGAHTYQDLELEVQRFQNGMGNSLPVEALVVTTDRTVLDYFARRYFRVPELKAEQLQLLQRALHDQSTIGILPTGFGKSLTYQLYAVLVPRTTLVISPLKSLMRDQLYNLHRLGFNCVEAISSDDSSTVKSAKLNSFLNHELRLLYLSPERLQIESFQQEVLEGITQVPIGALVIDEAHCVSEWGHDFRPAYLQLARYRDQLEAKLQRRIVTFGLTATASYVVEKDILALLQLEAEAIVRLSTADRSNLSFSVHRVSDHPLAKLTALQNVILKRIPQALELDSWQELIPLGKVAPFPHAGVIFAIYADPHGKTTIEEGVPAIAARVIETLARNPSLVQVYASKPTTCCPKCHSVFYVTFQKDGERFGQCYKCKAEFPLQNAHVELDWDREIIKRQNAFQANLFPLLVATKGYGMGIDKRNIRYVIHHALSSGMEGYFQEAGRAGRDGHHAHIALIYLPPTDSCYRGHLANNQPPPCVTDSKNLKFHKCPYGLKRLCDAGRQARFIAQNYPGQTIDKARMLNVLQKIVNKKGRFSCKNIVDDGFDPCRATEIQLYRLQLLGIVQNYSLQYKGLVVEFKVQTAPYDINSLATHATKYLRKLNSSEQVIDAAMARLKTADILSAAVDILLERIYAEIPTMRYTMLGNLLRYAKSEERGICRRIELRSTFDGDNLPLEDYRCGFCDVCRPDLDFQVDQALIPLGDEQINDISRSLTEKLSTFDINVLTTITELAENKGAIPGLYAKVSRLLERNPTNVPTLYLAGALALRQQQFAKLGFEQLKFCYSEAVRQGYTIDVLKAIYYTAKVTDNVVAFNWLNEVDGPFDQAVHFDFLQGETDSIWGKDSIPATNLRVLRQIRNFRMLHTDVAVLRNAVCELAER